MEIVRAREEEGGRIPAPYPRTIKVPFAPDRHNVPEMNADEPRPIVAITMGDPAGIGPELVVKVLALGGTWEKCRPLVVGDPGVMTQIAQVLGMELRFRAIADLSQAGFRPPEVDVLCPEGLQLGPVAWGKVDAAMGKAAALCLAQACDLAMAGEVQGIVSAPMNKQAFHLAGHHYFDELQYMADLTHSPETHIFGAMGSLWTVAVAEHVPFESIVGLVRKDRVLRHIAAMHRLLQGVGHARPVVGVAALNVHGGEGGLFGRQEMDEIEPAIAAAMAQGVDARGPIPADTLFPRALAGEFDGVVCMYHDQANIARKLRAWRGGATIFMGLPVPCGTTAHGTAFDIAGRGVADPGSLQAALEYTVLLSQWPER